MFSDKLVKMFSTFFYVGKFPAAPGSMASIVGALIYFALLDNMVLYVILFLIITAVGFMVSGDMERITGQKDPSCVVIDEVSGVMIAFFLIPVHVKTVPIVITTYFLFRAFDMFKIYPVNKFEEMPGGQGIMMDDIFAGFYTNIVMHIAIRWAGIV